MLKCTSPSVSANNMLLTVLSNFQLPHTLIWKEWPLADKLRCSAWAQTLTVYMNWKWEMTELDKNDCGCHTAVINPLSREQRKNWPPLPFSSCSKRVHLVFLMCSRFLSFISLSSWWRVALFIQYVQHVVLHHWSCALYTVFFNIIRSLYAIMHLHNLLPLHVWVTIFVDVVCCCTLIFFFWLSFPLHVLLSLLFLSYKGSDKYWVSISGQCTPSTISSKQAAFFSSFAYLSAVIIMFTEYLTILEMESESFLSVGMETPQPPSIY